MSWLRSVAFGVFLGILGGLTLKGIVWAVTGSWEVSWDTFLLVFSAYVFGIGAGWGYSAVCGIPRNFEKVEA